MERVFLAKHRKQNIELSGHGWHSAHVRNWTLYHWGQLVAAEHNKQIETMRALPLRDVQAIYQRGESGLQG